MGALVLCSCTLVDRCTGADRLVSFHELIVQLCVQYMDKTYVKNFQRKPAYQRGMEIWTEEIIQTEEVGGLLRKLFLEQVRSACCPNLASPRTFQSAYRSDLVSPARHTTMAAAKTVSTGLVLCTYMT